MTRCGSCGRVYPLRRSLNVRLGPRSSAHPVCEEIGGETRGGRQEEEGGKEGRRERGKGGGKEGVTRGDSGFSVAGYVSTLPIYFPMKTTFRSRRCSMRYTRLYCTYTATRYRKHTQITPTTKSCLKRHRPSCGTGQAVRPFVRVLTRV